MRKRRGEVEQEEGENTEGKKEDGSVEPTEAKEKSTVEEDQQRQQRLAVRRENVLRSLRGLITTRRGRGGRRKETTWSRLGQRVRKVEKLRSRTATAAPSQSARGRGRRRSTTGGDRTLTHEELRKQEAGRKETREEEEEGRKEEKDESQGTRGRRPEEEQERRRGGGGGGGEDGGGEATTEEEENYPPRGEGGGGGEGGGEATTEEEENYRPEEKEEEKRMEEVKPPQRKRRTTRPEEKEGGEGGGEEKAEEKEEEERMEEGGAELQGMLGDGVEQQSVGETRGTLLDSTLHRIHGDLRIALKSDSPDVSRCVSALDQLSMLYVTSRHVQKHSELVSTLRKMRYYRACQAVMDKASMLYCRFKNSFLLGEGEEVLSQAYLHSLLQEREREEQQRWKLEEERRKRGADGESRGEEEVQSIQTQGPMDAS
ncbi:unnamed protein product [Gadus morhua 'NCC']